MLLLLLQAAAALKAVELHAFTKSRGGGNPASVALVADWTMPKLLSHLPFENSPPF